MTTRFNGENYLFAVNGQTGKTVSKLPVDKGLAKVCFLKYAAVASAIAMGLSLLFM